MRSKRNKIIALALVLLAVTPALSGCGGGSNNAPQPSKAMQSLEDVFLTVRLPGGETKRFMRAEMEKLPEVTLSVDGKILDGPSLETVLKSSGAKDFSSITIDGEAGSVDVTKDDIQSGMLFDLSNPENLTFIIPDVPNARKITNVTTIKVE